MFTYHDQNSAPEASKKLMEQSIRVFNRVPNLHQILAEAPATYEAYVHLFSAFLRNTTFSPLEQQVVFMTANFENNCHYCVPGHTLMMKLASMPDDIIDALREGKTLPDSKLQALREFTKQMMDNFGHLDDAQLQAFIDAGYTKRQALEVITGLAAKLISNYTSALTKVELDENMKPYEWQHPDDSQ